MGWTTATIVAVCFLGLYWKVLSLSDDLKDIRNRMQMLFDLIERLDQQNSKGADNTWDSVQDIKRILVREFGDRH